MSQVFSVAKHDESLPHSALITIRIELFPETPDGECDGRVVYRDHTVEVVKGKDFEETKQKAIWKIREMYETFFNTN